MDALIEILIGAFVLLNFAITCLLIGIVLRQRDELSRLSTSISEAMPTPLPASDPISLPSPSPLECLRIALCIEQDHKLPILANLVKERLEAEDARVQIFNLQQASEYQDQTRWDPGTDKPHVVIQGRVKCNAYSDVFYEADITFLYHRGIVDSILEMPPNGGRQVNLAIGIVNRLKRTYEQSSNKAERLDALQELHELP